MAALVRVELRSEADAASAAARLAAIAPRAALPAHARARILSAAAAAVERDAEELARLIVAEVRKPVKEARREVGRASFNLRWAAEESRRIGGEIVPLDHAEGLEGRAAHVVRVPRGPALLITPFNFPLNLAVHKAAPAVAAGLPFALKPDPRAVKTAEALLSRLVEAGWPAEAALLATGDIPAVEALARDERVKVLSFTGSTAAGKRLASIAGMKRLVLELGSNTGVFVGADADLPWAAARCAWGATACSGQSCISVQRIVVEKAVHEEFRRLLVENLRELRVGEPEDEATDVGPMISEEAAARLESRLKEAVAAGAKLWAGGPRRGAVLPPALLEGVPAASPLWAEEAFGPVAVLQAAESRAQALDLLADTRFGLQAGLFTNDLAFVREAFARLPAGGVVVNDMPTWRPDAAPYGGVGDSGLGREGVRWAIEEYTERRALIL